MTWWKGWKTLTDGLPHVDRFVLWSGVVWDHQWAGWKHWTTELDVTTSGVSAFSYLHTPSGLWNFDLLSLLVGATMATTKPQHVGPRLASVLTKINWLCARIQWYLDVMKCSNYRAFERQMIFWIWCYMLLGVKHDLDKITWVASARSWVTWYIGTEWWNRMHLIMR